MIRLTTSPIRPTIPASSSTVLLVALAETTARSETAVDFCTCLPISWIEPESSSVAEATVWTFDDASSAAVATVTDCELVSRAIDANCSAEASSWVAAAVTCSITLPTLCSKVSASWLRAARRSASARRFCSACSCSRWRTRIALSLNTCTAAAIAPISSFWPRAGTSVSSWPSASRSIAPVMPETGRVMPREITQATSMPNTTAASEIDSDEALEASSEASVAAITDFIRSACAARTLSVISTLAVAAGIISSATRAPVENAAWASSPNAVS